MKALLTVLAALLLAGTLPAVELTADDKKVLAETEAALAGFGDAIAPESHAYSVATRAVLIAKPETFDALVTCAREALAPIAWSSEDKKTAAANSAIISAALWRFGGAYLVDGYRYAKEHGAVNSYFALHAKRLGMAEADELAGLLDIFSAARRGDLWIFKARHARLSALLNTLPEDEAKTILKKLNRVYSPKLVEDKDAYEPVVAIIRTMLATY